MARRLVPPTLALRLQGEGNSRPGEEPAPVAEVGASLRLTHACSVATCALAPAYVLRWHYGPLPTTALETAILVTLVVFALESLRERRVPRWRTPLTLPAALFLAAGLLAVATAPDLRAAAGLYRAYLLEPVAFALVTAEACPTVGRAQAVLAGLGVGALAAGIPNSVLVLLAIHDHTFHVTGTPPVVIYLTANALGLYLDPLIAVAGAVALFGRGRPRLASIVFLCLAVPVLLLTFSRGSWVALVAIALCLAAFHRRRLPLLAGFLIAAVVVSRIPLIARRIALDLTGQVGNTASFRPEMWAATLKLLATRPFLGAGLSGFQTRIAPYWNPYHPPSERFIDPHNIVLNFWVEVGLLGLIAFAWIWIAGFVLSLRGWRRGLPDWRPLHLGVLVALVAIVAHGLVDVPYFKNDLSLEFWALMAVTWAGLRWRAAGRDDGDHAASQAIPPPAISPPAIPPPP
jgi:O-antigen ligase